ncbi:hypothetical protein Vadar_013204 [Vaccinium darrowii]|uniref:Uncharacterized protein n=1 Tax=Vaccinium darrowii TaxID=229202 RepID=A0ACB7Z4F2_9ERIC|nr:hypothetical protein Vadar_013204 [Vaccinium darrowii]
MSSRGRGGRGTRSSPRKAFSQPLKDPTHVLCGSQTDCRIKWTDTMTMEFLKSVAKDIEEHGRATTGLSPAACIRVANDLHGKFDIPIINVQVKNRYYALKKEWDAWVLLSEGPSLTGVGRDPETGLVTRPEHWWKDMIAPTDYVTDMDCDNLNEESGDFDELTSVAHGPKGCLEGLLQTPTTSKGKAVSQPQSHIGSGSGSRKHKQQGGGSSEAMPDALAEHLSRVKKEPSIVITRRGRWGITDACDKLKELPIFRDIEDNMDLMFWAGRLFKNAQDKVDLFCGMCTTEKQMMCWLKSEHRHATEKHNLGGPMKDTYGVYAEPVDPNELPNYDNVLDRPMEVATVRKKLGKGLYSTLDQFETHRKSSTYHYDTASAHMENTSEEEECNFLDFDYESEPEVYNICAEVKMEQELALINTILEVGLASKPKKKTKGKYYLVDVGYPTDQGIWHRTKGIGATWRTSGVGDVENQGMMKNSLIGCTPPFEVALSGLLEFGKHGRV